MNWRTVLAPAVTGLAIAACGGSTPSAPSTVTSPPSSPIGLTAVVVWSTEVNLSWQATTGATGYKLERSLPPGSTWSVVGTSSTTTFSDIGLTSSTTYSYRVSATSGAGSSAPSAAVNVTTSAAGACPCSIWSNSITPTTIASTDATSNELGVKFRASVAGYVSGIRFYKDPTNTGTHTGHLWNRTGTLLGAVAFSNETASGWQTATLATPIPIAVGQTYVVSYYAPNGHYSQNVSDFASSGSVNGPLTALQDGVDGPNGVYQNESSGFPTLSYSSSNYWVDVVFVPE